MRSGSNKTLSMQRLRVLLLFFICLLFENEVSEEVPKIAASLKEKEPKYWMYWCQMVRRYHRMILGNLNIFERLK